jgi:hypothetical protein
MSLLVFYILSKAEFKLTLLNLLFFLCVLLLVLLLLLILYVEELFKFINPVTAPFFYGIIEWWIDFGPEFKWWNERWRVSFYKLTARYISDKRLSLLWLRKYAGCEADFLNFKYCLFA